MERARIKMPSLGVFILISITVELCTPISKLILISQCQWKAKDFGGEPPRPA